MSALPATTILFSFFWLLRNKKELLSRKKRKSELFNWDAEISSFRIKIGLTSLSGYFYSQIFIPILFFIEGPKMAGQMGVSLTIAGMLGVLSQSWITYQIPDLGKAAAMKEVLKINIFFKKSITHLSIFYFLGSLLIILFYLFFTPEEYKLRMLEVLPFIGVLISIFINQILWSLSSYVRSFKEEVFGPISLISILISTPLAIIATNRFSVTGTILSIILVQLFFNIPLSIFILKKFKKLKKIDSFVTLKNYQ